MKKRTLTELLVESVTCFTIACKGNPFRCLIVLFLIYFAFNSIESVVEELIFGRSFIHFMDPILMCAFLYYGFISLLGCYEYHLREMRRGYGDER